MDEAQCKLLKEIHRALIGDPLNPDKEPGLVKQHADMWADYYGCVDTKTIGTKEKTETLWEGRTKIIAICAFIAALGGLFAWLIPVISK